MDLESKWKFSVSDLPSLGYKHSFVEPNREEDACGLCRFVSRDPVQISPCGHTFCKTCLDFWFRLCEEGGKHLLHCPTDNDVVTRENVMLDCRLQKIITNLKVYCDNKSLGCMVTPTVRHFQSHLSICQFRMVNCTLSCGASMTECSLMIHMEEICVKRRAQCPLCREEMVVEEIEKHKDVCPMHPVTCTHCQKFTTLRCHASYSMAEHYEKCPEFPIGCHFTTFGCDTKMPRKNLKGHQKVYVCSHLMQLSVAFVRLQKENETLRWEISEQKCLADKDHSIQREKVAKDLTLLKMQLQQTQVDLMQCQLNQSKELEKARKEKDLLVDELQKCKNDVKAISYKMGENKNVDMDLSTEVESLKSKTCFSWRVEMNHGMEIKYSFLFFSKPGGYKLVASAFHLGETYIFQCFLLKGLYDDYLAWPLKGKITLSIADVKGKCLSSNCTIGPRSRRRVLSDKERQMLLEVIIPAQKSPVCVDVCVY